MVDTAKMFQCDGCGKSYRWRAELAGRKVKCQCGTVMTAPPEPPSAEDVLYDLASAAAIPHASQPVQSTAPRLVIPYRSAPTAAASPGIDDYFPDKFKDLQLPIILLAVGVTVELVAGWWTGARGRGGAAEALAGVGAVMLINTALMLVAVFLAAKLRGIAFGPFWTAVLKLSAIAVAPSALMTLCYIFLRFLPLGGLITWVIGFCFYFALLGIFFDLDQSDTWYCVIVIFLVKVAVVFVAAVLILG